VDNQIMRDSELRQRYQSLRILRVIVFALYGINGVLAGVQALSLTQPNEVSIILNFIGVLVFVFATYWSYFRDSFDKLRVRMDVERLANSLKSQIQTW
jgi:uncharacterized membrane protein